MGERLLYSERGIRKFARLWCENLHLIPVDKFRAGSNTTDYMLDIWMDLPWNPADCMAVLHCIAEDQDLRHIVHAFDVKYCEPRIVDWDPITHERFSAIYSLERDILVSSMIGHLYDGNTERMHAELAAWDPREDKRYGNNP